MNLVPLSKTVWHKNSELWTGCTRSIQYHSLFAVSVMPSYHNSFQSSIILVLKIGGHGIIITLHGYMTAANCTWFGGSGEKNAMQLSHWAVGERKASMHSSDMGNFCNHWISPDCNSCYTVCLCSQWLKNPVALIALTQVNWIIFRSLYTWLISLDYSDCFYQTP